MPVQRQPSGRPEPQAYVAHPAVLGDCAALLQRAFGQLDPTTLAVLRGWKTLAIGAVVDEAEPHVTIYHWATNGNWTTPALSAVLDGLGVRRWDADPARQARGAGGAPGDAEQRLMSGHTLKAIAVSRPPCADCQAALGAYGVENGTVLTRVMAPPNTAEVAQRVRALGALQEEHDRLVRSLSLHEGEHQAQAALINTPSVTGFAGFWTNRLFNGPVPPPTIWANAFGALLAAQREIATGNVAQAYLAIRRAQLHLALAVGRYVRWKEGIEPAGTKAQVAIGLAGAAAIAAFVAGPALIARLGLIFESGATTAATGAAEEQMVVRIAALAARSDAAVLAMEEAVVTAEIEAIAAEEAAAFFAALGG